MYFAEIYLQESAKNDQLNRFRVSKQIFIVQKEY